MSDLVDAQKEFEELIKQLEKLKHINQITSENAENAENIIKEVHSLNNKTGSYLKSVNANHTKIEENVKNVIVELDKSIGESKLVNRETIKLVTQKFENLEDALKEISQFESETQKNIETAQKTYKENKDWTEKNFSEMEAKLSSISDKIKLLQNNQVKSEKNLLSKIDSVDQLFKDSLYKVESKLVTNKKEMNDLKNLIIATLVIMVIGFMSLILLIHI